MSYKDSARHQRIGARGPLQEEAKRLPCCACGGPGSDPAHLERVGRGFGDWKRLGARWVGRVANLCRRCHGIMDRQIPAPCRLRRAILAVATTAAVQIGEKWAAELGLDLSAPLHPYIQWRERGEPHPADIV